MRMLGDDLTTEEIEAQLQEALDKEGLVIVPREPTVDMLIAGCRALEQSTDEIMGATLSGAPHAIGRTKMRIRYKAMIEAYEKN